MYVGRFSANCILDLLPQSPSLGCLLFSAGSTIVVVDDRRSLLRIHLGFCTLGDSFNCCQLLHGHLTLDLPQQVLLRERARGRFGRLLVVRVPRLEETGLVCECVAQLHQRINQ